MVVSECINQVTNRNAMNVVLSFQCSFNLIKIHLNNYGKVQYTKQLKESNSGDNDGGRTWKLISHLILP